MCGWVGGWVGGRGGGGVCCFKEPSGLNKVKIPGINIGGNSHIRNI